MQGKQDPNSAWLAVFMTYGDVFWLMWFNLWIYNEKTARIFCFSSKWIPSHSLPSTPIVFPLPCWFSGPALLMCTSDEGWTAISIRVLWEVYARLRLVGYSRLLCPSVWGERKRERVVEGIKRRKDIRSQKPVWGHFVDVKYLILKLQHGAYV